MILECWGAKRESSRFAHTLCQQTLEQRRQDILVLLCFNLYPKVRMQVFGAEPVVKSEGDTFEG